MLHKINSTIFTSLLDTHTSYLLSAFCSLMRQGVPRRKGAVGCACVPVFCGVFSTGCSREVIGVRRDTAYGEGSGADCRRHVQKLNLLQGQISELSFRSLGESVSANEEENVDPWQAAHASPQEKLQPSKNRWLKYLERDSEELGLKEGGVCFNRQPSSEREKPDPLSSTGLPRKRKWNQSTVQPPCGPDVQDSRNCEVTLKSLKDHPLHSTWSARSSPDYSTWDLPWISEELSPSFTQDRAGLAGKGRGSSREDRDTVELVPQGEPPCPAQQVRTVSKWEQCLMPRGNSSHLDTEPLTPLQRGLRPIQAAQAEQGTPRAQTPREEGLCRIPGARQSPQTTHTPMPGPKRLCGRIPEQSQGAGPWAEGAPLVKGVQARSSLMRLCDLFKTGEDFDDDL
ncbi:MRN complex-interacting protein isoform 2-T2 [Dama dama]|uniref:MRN complex-interacting protein isoform X2 n=1 Tax=Dama dama TaxID=30532 RepID=UPI002A36AC2D|nr:MRN complex-interacting protein isoform X2 [Dama dama]